jgi:hypothetical protein
MKFSNGCDLGVDRKGFARENHGGVLSIKCGVSIE